MTWSVVGVLFLLPKLGHVFESLALGLRDELPDEDCGNDADDAIHAIDEPEAEAVGHRHERCRDNPVEDPLESHGDGYGCTTDGVGEDFGNEHPADWTP